jgi:hypothetical protein
MAAVCASKLQGDPGAARSALGARASSKAVQGVAQASTTPK